MQKLKPPELAVFLLGEKNVDICRCFVAIAFISAFTSFAVLATVELIIHEVIFTILGYEPQQIGADNIYWKLMGMPQAVIMILLALIVSKLRVPEKGAWKI